MERMQTYEQLYASFRWDIPARYNIAADVGDRQQRTRQGRAHRRRVGRQGLANDFPRHSAEGRQARRTFCSRSDLSRATGSCCCSGRIRGQPSATLPVGKPARLRAGVGVVRGRCGRVSDWAMWQRALSLLTWRICRPPCGPRAGDRGGAHLRDRRPRAGSRIAAGRDRAARDTFTNVDTAADDPAFLNFTSGTTGNPKGALQAHRSMLGHLPGAEFCLDFFPQPHD